MAFSHNRHYHRLLLRHVPEGCRRALDAGCGRGEFTERLARHAGHVDAFDLDAEMVAATAARCPAPIVHVRQEDLLDAALEEEAYDYIACLASLHHVPLGRGLTALRDALAPGGTLVVLGLYREATPSDWALSLAALPVNALMRIWHTLTRTPPQGAMPVRNAITPLAEIRREAAHLLPGAQIRRLLFWRYVLVYRKDGPDAGRRSRPDLRDLTGRRQRRDDARDARHTRAPEGTRGHREEPEDPRPV